MLVLVHAFIILFVLVLGWCGMPELVRVLSLVFVLATAFMILFVLVLTTAIGMLETMPVLVLVKAYIIVLKVLLIKQEQSSAADNHDYQWCA